MVFLKIFYTFAKVLNTLKMQMQHKFIFITLCLLLLSFITSCSGEKPVKRIHYNGSYNRDFNDLNEPHLKSAKLIGIEPVADREEAEHLKKKLKEIKSNKYYTIRELTHSIPFLVPQASDLLDKIGKNFNDSLKSLNAPKYKLIVTSVTRTKGDVKRLRKGNGNASENSAHMYATTFDISWSKYEKDSKRETELTPDQLKMVLASVLRDLRKQDLCYIKHERKQACFHITAR